MNPYRPRTPSGHDIPVPESVFHAIHSVSQDVKTLTTELRTTREETKAELAEVKALAVKASAQSVERWTNLAKALVPAVIAIVGGTVGVQKLTTPAAPEPTRIFESSLSAELVKCQALPEAEQRYCVANAYETDKLRRGGGRP
jgi:hypothetical protein